MRHTAAGSGITALNFPKNVLQSARIPLAAEMSGRDLVVPIHNIYQMMTPTFFIQMINKEVPA
jgi:hypothetical protein